jgi:hypothetical protein
MTLSAGTRLGPYEILTPIGAGGMGEAYRRLRLLADLPSAPARGSRGCALDREPGPRAALRLPRREPPPSLRSGDFSRRERKGERSENGSPSLSGGRLK